MSGEGVDSRSQGAALLHPSLGGDVGGPVVEVRRDLMTLGYEGKQRGKFLLYGGEEPIPPKLVECIPEIHFQECLGCPI